MTTLIDATNTPWEMLDDCQETLAAVAIKGTAVFPQVVRTTAKWQPEEAQLLGLAPIAVLRQAGTRQYDLPDDVYGGLLSVNLSVYARHESGVDQHEAMKENLRLLSVAKNALETDPPSDAVAMGGPDSEFHHALEWGEAEPQEDLEPPWTGFAIPLELSYRLATSTSH